MNWFQSKRGRLTCILQGKPLTVLYNDRDETYRYVCDGEFSDSFSSEEELKETVERLANIKLST